jgi:hypothetical protein
MKHSLHTKALLLAAAGLFAGLNAKAGDLTDCDKVAETLRAAVTADPAKVLLLVEDAMVANETCACEIVKTAILASQANADLMKQIVLTATNVAPNMSAMIAECATAMAPDNSKDVAESIKQSIEVQPDAPDYKKAAPDIRGVYLIQPAAGGVVINKEEDCEVVVKHRPRKPTPQSPSSASHKH